MAVVIQNATKGVIFAYSLNEKGDCKYQILNLETHFKNKPFDIKLLYNKGIDIVASGNAFVSNIVFDESHNKAITPEFYKVKSNYDSYLDTLKAAMKKNSPHPRYKCGIECYDWYKGYKGSHLKTIDYYNHENWTLTYKMRGFTDLYSKHFPEDDKNIYGVTAYSINLILKARQGELEDYYECEEEELEEESEYEPDELEETSEESEEEDDEEMEEDTDPEDEVLIRLFNTKLDDKNDKTWMYHYFGREYSPLGSSKWSAGFKDCPEFNNDSFGSYSNNSFLCNLPDYLDFVKKPKGLQPEHIKALKDIDFDCVYIEHESITPKCIEIKERQLNINLTERSKILDLYEEGSETPYGTVIEISPSPPLTDYELHSDEGFYNAGINYYNNNQGIVLIGEQNMPTMFYGTAVEDGFYIPDVFYDNI